MCLESLITDDKKKLPKTVRCYGIVKVIRTKEVLAKRIRAGTRAETIEPDVFGKVVRLKNGRMSNGSKVLVFLDKPEGHDGHGFAPTKHRKRYWWIRPGSKTVKRKKPMYTTYFRDFPVKLGKTVQLRKKDCEMNNRVPYPKYPMGFHRYANREEAKFHMNTNHGYDCALIEFEMSQLVAEGKQDRQRVYVGLKCKAIRVVAKTKASKW